MKAIHYLALMLVALIGLTACSDDDKDGHFFQLTYTGKNTVTVDHEYDPVVITCKVTKNDDGTLDVEMPEYQLPNTKIGDLTIGAVTIKKIAYNEERGAYYRIFGKDRLKMDFKSEGGMVNINGNFDFTEDSNIEVQLKDNGVLIVLDYTFPAMEPMHLRINSKFDVDIVK